MAADQYRGKMEVSGPAIKSFGTFCVTEHGSQKKVTLTAALEPEPVSISPGSEMQVEEVIPENGEAFLRLIPVGDSDGDE